jgi:hypothetical protein
VLYLLKSICKSLKGGEKREKQVNYAPCTRNLGFLFFAVLGFELRALYFELFHQPFFMMGFFERGSHGLSV